MTAHRPPEVEGGAVSPPIPAARPAGTGSAVGALNRAAPERGAGSASHGVIAASRCPRCSRTCAPPARFCPDDGAPMAPATVPAHGEVVSFTTLYSPPTGFASPLHLALVELPGGAKFFCHGTGTKGLRPGARVAIEAVDDIYYFSTLSLRRARGALLAAPRRDRNRPALRVREERRPAAPPEDPMRPLDGVRVIDLSRVLAGPYATMLLADMGAEVIKVEEPGKGDDTRAWPAFAGGESTYFMSVNRGKKSVTLDLKAEAGKTVLRKLLASADVLVENFRPGTLARLGFGWEAVHALNPRLVYCSISGFGESGPEASRPGYDLIVQGESGVMDLTGFPDGPPVKVGNSIADLASGTMAAHGVVLALLARERTGAGQKVEIAMLEVMAALLTYQGQGYLTTGASPRRRGNQHPSIVPYEVFEAADGYLTVGVANNSLWARFCQGIGHPELATDARFDTEIKRVEHRDVLVPLLGAIFRTAPAAEWLGAARARGRAGGEDQVGGRGAGVGASPGARRDRDREPSDRGAHADGRAADPAPRDARRGRDARAAARRAHGRGPDEGARVFVRRGRGAPRGRRRLVVLGALAALGTRRDSRPSRGESAQGEADA